MIRDKPVEVGDIIKVWDRLGKRKLKKAEEDPVLEVEDGRINYETVVKAVGTVTQNGKTHWVVMHHPQGIPAYLRSGKRRNPSFSIATDAGMRKGITGEDWGIVMFEKVGRD